ncbi:MAG: hypothetical protein P8Y44_07795 [Acidobacteriota bacterium]
MSVVYTGQSHFSAGNNWIVVRRRLDNDPQVVSLFDGIADLAQQIVASLERGELEAVAQLISREWELRRQLSAGKSTPMIESVDERGLAAGAWGGKACGAGGGGCVVLLSPPQRRQDVTTEIEAIGGEVLATRPVSSPLQLV